MCRDASAINGPHQKLNSAFIAVAEQWHTHENTSIPAPFQHPAVIPAIPPRPAQHHLTSPVTPCPPPGLVAPSLFFSLLHQLLYWTVRHTELH